jgi:hypothetical protein
MVVAIVDRALAASLGDGVTGATGGLCESDGTAHHGGALRDTLKVSSAEEAGQALSRQRAR